MPPPAIFAVCIALAQVFTTALADDVISLVGTNGTLAVNDDGACWIGSDQNVKCWGTLLGELTVETRQSLYGVGVAGLPATFIGGSWHWGNKLSMVLPDGSIRGEGLVARSPNWKVLIPEYEGRSFKRYYPASYESACAQTVDDDLLCWGYRVGDVNRYLGLVSGCTPVKIAEFSVHYFNVCAIKKDDGSLFCFRLDETGVCPFDFPALAASTSVFQPPAGEFRGVTCPRPYDDSKACCAISISDSTAVCWNREGVIGTATENVGHFTPPATQFDSISVGYDFACGVTFNTYTLQCWGNDNEGVQSGVPAGQASEVSCGAVHCCAVMQDPTDHSKSVTCWGALRNRAGTARDPPASVLVSPHVHWSQAICIQMNLGDTGSVCDGPGLRRVDTLEDCNQCAFRWRCDGKMTGVGIPHEEDNGWCTGARQYGSEYAHHFPTGCSVVEDYGYPVQMRYNPLCEIEGQDSGNCVGGRQHNQFSPICIQDLNTYTATSTLTTTVTDTSTSWTQGSMPICIQMNLGDRGSVCDGPGLRRVSTLEDCNQCAVRWRCDGKMTGVGVPHEQDNGWCTGARQYGSEYAHHFPTGCSVVEDYGYPVQMRYNPLCEIEGQDSGHCVGGLQLDVFSPVCIQDTNTYTATSTLTPSVTETRTASTTATTTTSVATYVVTTATVTSTVTTASVTATTTTSVTTYVTTTSVTTAVATTGTVTSTSTVTGSAAAHCTLERLRCPIPRALVTTDYVVLGNETALPGEPCGPPVRAASEQPVFDVDVALCNVSTARTAGRIDTTVTLIPRAGTLVFTTEPATLVCSCRYDVVAAVSVSAGVYIPEATRDVGGGSGFEPALRLFADASFSDAVLPGGAFPSAAERFFVEVSTNVTEDIIGVPRCTAAPTGEEDDGFQQVLWDQYCVEPMFGAEQLGGPGVDGATHRVQWSIAKFKFAGFAHVHLACTVVRCASPPCGVCDERRLEASPRGLQQSAAGVAALEFDLAPGDYLVLPGAVAEADKLVKYESPPVGPRSDPEVMWTNVTVYGLPNITDGPQFAHAFQTAIGPFVAEDVPIYQVWQVAGARNSEMTIISFFQPVNGTTSGDFDSRLARSLHAGGFLTQLLEAMGATGANGQHIDLMRVEVESTVGHAPDTSPRVAPPAATAEGPAIAIIVAFVAATVMAAGTAIAFAWWRRRGRGKGAAEDAANSPDPTIMDSDDRRPAAKEGAAENEAGTSKAADGVFPTASPAIDEAADPTAGPTGEEAAASPEFISI